MNILDRFDLALRFVEHCSTKTLDLTILVDPTAGPIFEELIELSGVSEEVFDNDLTAQLTVAMETFHKLCGELFEVDSRVMLAQASHPAIRKILRRPEQPEAIKIAPHVGKYWFLYRPVAAKMCTYRELFVDEIYSFSHIHRMHEMLDLEQFNEIVAAEVDQP